MRYSHLLAAVFLPCYLPAPSLRGFTRIRRLVCLMPLGLHMQCWQVGQPPEQHKTPGEMLHALVENTQLTAIRPSYGVYAGQNFSTDDLNRFVATNEPGRIVDRLQQGKQFQAVVTALRALPRAQADSMLAAARAIRRPMWEETGVIGSGTTRAGAFAATLIAIAATDALAIALKAPGSTKKPN